MNLQIGDIGFTSRKPQLKKPGTYVSFVINLLQTKKLRNLDQTPTHTFQIIDVKDGKYYVIDSDVDGLEPEEFTKWSKGRNFIIIYRPMVLLSVKGVETYVSEAMLRSGDGYGFKSILSFVWFLLTKRYKGKLTTPKDNMICSVFTAYLYRDFIKDWQIQTPISLFNNCKLKKGEKGKYFIDGYFVFL